MQMTLILAGSRGGAAALSHLSRLLDEV